MNLPSGVLIVIKMNFIKKKKSPLCPGFYISTVGGGGGVIKEHRGSSLESFPHSQGSVAVQQERSVIDY